MGTQKVFAQTKTYKSGKKINAKMFIDEPSTCATDLIVTVDDKDKDAIVAMLDAGMDIARFELTPDNQEEVVQSMFNLKEVLAANEFQHCKIMVDIVDPSESCSLVKPGSYSVKKEDTFFICSKK